MSQRPKHIKRGEEEVKFRVSPNGELFNFFVYRNIIFLPEFAHNLLQSILLLRIQMVVFCLFMCAFVCLCVLIVCSCVLIVCLCVLIVCLYVSFIRIFVPAKEFIASISHYVMGDTSIGTRATGFFSFFYFFSYNSKIGVIWIK